MNKNVLIFLAFVGLMTACNSSQKKAEKDGSQEPVTLTVNDFLTKAGDYVGEEIVIKGTVSHVCKHGGKRMFIFDDNEDTRVKIEAGEGISSFDASLEGSDVEVKGVLKELVIDENYITEWELEVSEEVNHHEDDSTATVGHESSGLGESADQGEHISAMESIENYRQQIKESGKDHLSFYSVECNAYELISADTIR